MGWRAGRGNVSHLIFISAGHQMNDVKTSCSRVEIRSLVCGGDPNLSVTGVTAALTTITCRQPATIHLTTANNTLKYLVLQGVFLAPFLQPPAL